MTIEQLKQTGHDLIEEYMTYLNHHPTKSKRVQAYEHLSEKMRGKNPHFSNMKEKNEVMLAIGSMKKLIFKMKNKDLCKK
jgi:hypothetical protein